MLSFLTRTHPIWDHLPAAGLSRVCSYHSWKAALPYAILNASCRRRRFVSEGAANPVRQETTDFEGLKEVAVLYVSEERGREGLHR